MAGGVGGVGSGDAIANLQTNFAEFSQMMTALQQYSSATTAVNVQTNTALATDSQVKDTVNGAVTQAREYNNRIAQNTGQWARG